MQTQDTFMALVYEHDQENDQTRCNAVKFTYDMAKDEWNEPKQSRVILPTGEDDNNNCYQIDDYELLLVMKYRCLVIDSNFEVLTNFDFRSLFEFKVTGEIIQCKPDFFASGENFILSFADVDIPTEYRSEFVFYGKSDPSSSSWVSVFKFDNQTRNLQCTAKEFGSVYLEQERVLSTIAIAPNKLLMTTHSSKVLLFQDWSCIQVYNEEFMVNDCKWFMQPLPDFHEETFPFVACSGSSYINLINVNTDYMEPIVETETSCWGQQQPFFFKKEEKGMTLHYSSVELLPNNRKSLKWVQMKLQPDFKKTLKKLGCMPVRSMDEIVKIQLDNADL